MRYQEGAAWLKRLSVGTGKSVLCAADFIKKPRLLLEARRRQLYKEMPVPKNWHRDYTQGKVDVEPYRKWREFRA